MCKRILYSNNDLLFQKGKFCYLKTFIFQTRTDIILYLKHFIHSSPAFCWIIIKGRLDLDWTSFSHDSKLTLIWIILYAVESAIQSFSNLCVQHISVREKQSYLSNLLTPGLQWFRKCSLGFQIFILIILLFSIMLNYTLNT